MKTYDFLERRINSLHRFRGPVVKVGLAWGHRVEGIGRLADQGGQGDRVIDINILDGSAG